MAVNVVTWIVPLRDVTLQKAAHVVMAVPGRNVGSIVGKLLTTINFANTIEVTAFARLILFCLFCEYDM